MPNFDIKIRESLHAYIDGSSEAGTDLPEPVLIRPRRHSRAFAVAGAALVVAALTGVLAVSVPNGANSVHHPDRAVWAQTEPLDRPGTEVTATWLPAGLELTGYTRQNDPAAPEFDSSWVYQRSSDATLLISRHETVHQADADRAALGQLRADPTPSPGWFGYRLLTGDTLLVVQGTGIPDASDQLRRVIEGLQISEDGNCITDAAVRWDGVCAPGSFEIPDSHRRNETATTSTTTVATDIPLPGSSGIDR